VSEIVKKLRVERFVTSGTADKSYAELFAEVCWEARAALREKKDGNV